MTKEPGGTSRHKDVVVIETLDVAAMWQHHDAHLFQANRISAEPFFYPLYRWNDLYSFSPLPLLRRKGTFRPHPKAVADLQVPNADVSRPMPFIDRDIARVGGPPELSATITDRSTYATKIAKAMQQDVVVVEAANRGKTNVILCGGRDSLNLLLLNWTNPVLVFSAQPNTPLVRAFVAENGLDYEVRELQPDGNLDLLDCEIAEAMAMVELENWKWTAHLVEVARDLGGQAVFWKGQMADSFFTDYWRSYSSSRDKNMLRLRKVAKRIARLVPRTARASIDTLLLPGYRRALWERGAVGQGGHMGFLRSLTDCLWVSAYHGPHTAAVWTSADLSRIIGPDIRPEIGARLLGREVCYPTTNPAPPNSDNRKGLRTLDRLKAALSAQGIPPIED